MNSSMDDQFAKLRRLACLAVLMPLAGCITMEFGSRASVCAIGWSKGFADDVAGEADALPADAATREALAQLVEIRKALPRC